MCIRDRTTTLRMIAGFVDPTLGTIEMDGQILSSPAGSVLIPLLKKSLAGAWILVFIPATRELSSAIFLVGPNTRVISVMLFDLSEEGNFEVLSALGVILLIATVAIAGIGSKIIGRDFMLRRN